MSYTSHCYYRLLDNTNKVCHKTITQFPKSVEPVAWESLYLWLKCSNQLQEIYLAKTKIALLASGHRRFGQRVTKKRLKKKDHN